MDNKKKARIMLIGCGPHAKRVYLPALRELSGAIDLMLVIDLKCKESDVRSAATASKWERNLSPELHFIDPFAGAMPEELDHYLSSFVAANGINGVIIATEPLVHRTYAEWALRNGLNILIDKPITARADSTNKMSSAVGIMDD